MADLQFVIGTKRNQAAADHLLAEFRGVQIGEGTLYLGYPVLSTENEQDLVDALLTSSRFGIVVFDLLPSIPQTQSEQFWRGREEKQTRIFLAITSKLLRHPVLTQKRKLAVPVNIFGYTPNMISPPPGVEVPVIPSGHLAEILNGLPPMDRALYAPLNAAIESVATIKPAKKRPKVASATSKGAVIRRIEQEIANLDRWQKRGAIECPDGPQRLRGLAGSGKTVALALKAAYLHAQNPEWDIAITFYTRSLYQQFTDLIRRFSFEHSSDEPNWSKVHVLHAWGSTRKPGLYAEAAQTFGLAARDYNSAKVQYSAMGAFEGICNELEEATREKEFPVYDAILIDEAQDLPHSFFKVLFRVAKKPKRIVYAYDELQSLSGQQMLPADDLFGRTHDGIPRVTLSNQGGEPHRDVILPVCYRNTPWTLVAAHALGFGIYREDGLVQLFEDPDLWDAIGYQIVDGDPAPGHNVKLRRKEESYPQFFNEILTPQDSLQCFTFGSPADQARAVAEMIQTNISLDELDPDDILVIFPDPVSVAAASAALRTELADREIGSHIAGVTTSQDEFFHPGSVAVSGIYRAKGNEAPMVYVMDSQWCFGGYELIRKRNILFTAMTRSRAWVRMCGVGDLMQSLEQELSQVVAHDFQLEFPVPTTEALARLRRIHRDMTKEDKKKHELVEKFAEMIQSGDIDPEDLPVELRRKFAETILDSTKKRGAE